MKIAKLFERGRPVFSFEFFPPRTDAGYTSLFRTIAELKELTPGFVSVTWGAGGSTRRKTVELVARIQGEIGLTAMAHLTCIGSSRSELAETLDRLDEAGIENVLALGGDRPEGYTPPHDGLSYASELAGFIRSRWGFCLGGACYPETHPRAASRADDLRHLGEKVASGVDFLITQLFFDNRDYFRFVDEARRLGIAAPIVPGIMPVVSAASVRRMAELSGAHVPAELSAELDAAGDDPERTLAVGVRWATRQCRDLLARGAPGIHFYTLNRSSATRDICAGL
jgi:methylenetetrahydrofolate reductase (NADPH)